MSFLRRIVRRDPRLAARQAEVVASGPPLQDRPHDPTCLLHLGSQFDEPGERKWLARRAMSTLSLANTCSSPSAATDPPGRRCNSAPTSPFYSTSSDLGLKRGDKNKFLLHKFLNDLLAEESHRLKRLMASSGWPVEAEEKKKRSKRPSLL